MRALTMRTSLVGTLLIGLLPATGCGPQPEAGDDTGSSAAAVAGGTNTGTTSEQSIVPIYNPNNVSDGPGFPEPLQPACSGIAVTKKLLLTSSTCAAKLTTKSVVITDGFQHVREVRVHPNGSDVGCKPGDACYDVGLVLLWEPLPDSVGFKKPPLTPPVASPVLKYGGYGASFEFQCAEPGYPQYKDGIGFEPLGIASTSSAVFENGRYTVSFPFSGPRPSRGDIGGPLFLPGTAAEPVGDVIGLLSDFTCNATSEIATFVPTWRPDLAEWIDTNAKLVPGAPNWFGEPTSVGDSDGDGVPETTGEDNCPFDYNPDQKDSDKDGLGDVCDMCPEDPNADQVDNTLEAELMTYDRKLWNLDDYKHVVPTDPPAYVAQRRTHYRGDACKKKLHWGPTRVVLDKANLPAICQGKLVPINCLFLPTGSNSLEVTNKFQGEFSKFGFRHCKCDAADQNSALGRVKCEEQCPFAGGEYGKNPDETNWKATSIPEFQPQFSNGAVYKVPWTTASTQGADAGLVWTHTLPPSGAFDDIGPDPVHAVKFTDRANAYANGKAKSTSPLFPLSPDDFVPKKFYELLVPLPPDPNDPFAGGNSLQSQTRRRSYLTVTEGRQFSVTAEGIEEVTSRYSGVAGLLARTDGRFLGPSEPAGYRTARGNNLAFVHVTDSGVVDAVARYAADGSIFLERGPRGFAPAAASTATVAQVGEGWLAVASQNRIVAIGGSNGDGSPRTDLRSYDLATQTWTSIPLYGGAKPQNVLAAAYRATDGMAYVIDEVKVGPLRVARALRISLQGRVQVLGLWPRLKKGEIFMSTGEHDELVLGFNHGNANMVVLFTLDDAGDFKSARWSQGPGKLTAAPHVGADFVTTAVLKAGQGHLQDEPIADLQPHGGLGSCWW